MLSVRFIVAFFVGAILLAWIIPSAWMESEKVIAPLPTSPWRSVVSIDDVVWGNGTPYIHVSVNDLDSPIFISGWSLENERGERAEIGLGVESFSQEALPIPERIRITAQTSLYISFSEPPVGVSFREHLCSGYLRGTVPLAPPVEARCPDLSAHPRWGILDTTCQLFLSSLPQCEVASPEHLADMSLACENFLRTVPTYSSCMKEVGERGALPLWRIFIPDRAGFIKETGGTILLKDEGGMVVDTLSYQTIGI